MLVVLCFLGEWVWYPRSRVNIGWIPKFQHEFYWEPVVTESSIAFQALGSISDL
jgi:hypothetical protein